MGLYEPTIDFQPKGLSLRGRDLGLTTTISRRDPCPLVIDATGLDIETIDVRNRPAPLTTQ
jgi:hypothetical protein